MKNFSRLAIACTLAATTLCASAASTFRGTRDDFRDETIYFAMTTRFYDGDPKNNVLSWDKQDVQKSKNDPDWRGDFAGLIEKLDYIKALGFTAIWITPITQNASGEDYHGYHSMDFGSVDLRYESRKEWGSAKDVKFQDLIDAAHAKGMKVILDIVLNHTSNFGEVTLNPLFTRDQNIRNQATPAGSLVPNSERLSAGYFDQDGNKQYQERFKFFKNPDYDTHNYYHHYGTGWNWDLPNRWWGQIAGDCVDLNTENDVVAQYLVNCYGEFIKMGVDGFRIDTTGHISRLTFNTQFIPQFTKLAEQYKSKRADGGAFIMFGECCARFGEVIYRNQHNLSSHFYTWKSEQSAIDKFKSQSTQAWWDTQRLNEGHDTPVGPMIVCESETSFNKNSQNVFMQNGQWHTPDYSQYSGFSVIDFPMHYNFNNAGQAINIAKQGDHYYNDASYNVVYVDSHDYCPGPNDGTRFNGGTEQWAENLSLMFTFRGIPCIYYGSEVEFKKGKPIDVGGENNKTPRSESGRAYFGEYLKGNVSASDFGVYTADGNVAKTLNADLAQHIIMLNKIRAAVPALRKGQYTFDGCSGNIAFKRAYNKNGEDSYACVAINGGATFSNLPAGTYVDLVTGDSKTVSANGSFTCSAPSNKGQLRVYVKNWKDGKIGDDGKFIYASTSKAKGGSVEFTDPGTTEYYTAADVIGRPGVKFTPEAGTFKTATLNVTISLNDAATSGTYRIGANGTPMNMSKGGSYTATIGADMNFGDTKQIFWTATDGSDTQSGSVTYKKVDPNAVITVYVTGKNNANIENCNMYAWNTNGDLLGSWPGKSLSSCEKTVIDGRTFYSATFDEETLNVIFNGNGQTSDITGITADTYYEYDGGTNYNEVSVNVGPKAPVIKASPASGTSFTDNIEVTLSASPATDIYYTLNGSKASASSTKYTGPISISETTTINAYAKNEVGESNATFTYTKRDKSAGITVYVAGSYIENNYMYAWTGDGDNATKLLGEWPGKKFSEMQHTDINNTTYYYYTFTDKESVNVIFNQGNGQPQTDDIKNITQDTYFKYNGGTTYEKVSDPYGNGSGNTDTPQTGEYTYNVYFDPTNSGWGSVINAYIWDDEENKYAGGWPGSNMTLKTIDGRSLYHYSFTANAENIKGKLHVIFNNNGGNGDNQTNNFDLVDKGIYNKSGYTNGQVTGVENLESVAGLKVAVRGGQVIIYSEIDCVVRAYRIDGTVYNLNVTAGMNYIDLPHGFYVIDGHKVVL